MYVRLTTAEEYFRAFTHQATVFGTYDFNRQVRSNAEMVRYAIGCDDADGYPLIGLILGLKEGVWMAPYSAPFALPAVSGHTDLESIYDFVNELTAMLSPLPLQVTLAPPIYDAPTQAAYAGVMGNCADKCIFDYNYHYPLERVACMERHMTVSFRNQWHQASGSPMQWIPEAGIERAYACVKANHDAKKYPLRMSLQQLTDTSRCIRIDSFVIVADGGDIAGAIVYRTAPHIAQLIYWGDRPGYSALRPMNMMAVRLVQHYAALGMDILDFGPASSRGIPASGLCHFKRGLGCQMSLKPTFVFKN